VELGTLRQAAESKSIEIVAHQGQVSIIKARIVHKASKMFFAFEMNKLVADTE
jgi:hypothetical protein